jgi:hypothetical protein
MSRCTGLTWSTSRARSLDSLQCGVAIDAPLTIHLPPPPDPEAAQPCGSPPTAGSWSRPPHGSPPPHARILKKPTASRFTSPPSRSWNRTLQDSTPPPGPWRRPNSRFTSRRRDPEGAPTRGSPPATGILEPLLSNKRTKHIIHPPPHGRQRRQGSLN